MNLIDKYMLKVTNTVTFSQEAGEIVCEIRDLIEDNLDGDNSLENIKRVLNELGDPRELALSYLDQDGAFISAEWVPYYYRGLKMSYKIAMIIVLVVHIILTLVNIADGNNIFIAIIRPIPLYIIVAPFVFTIVTLIFFIMSKTISVEEYVAGSPKQSFKNTISGSGNSIKSSGSKGGNIIKTGKAWDISELSDYKYDEDFKTIYKAKSIKLNIILQFISAAIFIFIVIVEPLLTKYDINLFVDKYVPYVVLYIVLMTVLNSIIIVKCNNNDNLYNKDMLILTVFRGITRLTLLFLGLIVYNVIDLTDVFVFAEDIDITSELFFSGIYAITAIVQVVLVISYIIQYKKNYKI